MKRTKKLLSLLLAIALVLTAVPFSGISVSAYDEPLLNSEGYYELSTADHLYWFAEQVNSGNNSINGVLMNDIAVNEEDDNPDDYEEIAWINWKPIGNGFSLSYGDCSYMGTFDGAGYTISNVTCDDRFYAGLFGYNKGTIKNLYIENSFFTGNGDTGAICGRNDGTIENCHSSSEVIGIGEWSGGVVGLNVESIKNCSNSGDVTSTSAEGYVGGICGMACGKIENCYNTGNISGISKVGGIVGGNETDENLILSNCYNIGTITGTTNYDVGAIVGEITYKVSSEKESYYLEGCAPDYEPLLGTKSKNAEQFASGEVAYLLNDGVTDGTQVWYQNLDNGEKIDEYPTFSGGTVYKNEKCSLEGFNFNYSNTYIEAGHSFVDGTCTVCGTFQIAPAVLVTSENYTELGLAEDYIGYYAINNAGNLYWFAETANNQDATINGVLMNDIVINKGDLSGYDGISTNDWKVWNPIGGITMLTMNPYQGVFDGAGYSISGLYINDEEAYVAGLFGIVSGIVKNVDLKNSYFYAMTSASICGLTFGGSVLNCSNESEVKALMNAGGICASNLGYIEDCYNIGTISGEEDVGGVCGLNSGIIQNCYNIGTVIGGIYVGSICGDDSALIQNCYYLEGCAIDGSGTVQNGEGSYTEGSTTEDVDGVTTVKSAEQFASGEVAYLLNNGVTDGTQVWYQNIDNGETVDEIPQFIGGTVYQYYNTCEDDVPKYSNTDEGFVTQHRFNNGVCDGCGASFINPWKSQIRFDKNEDGTFSGTFDYRVLATITSDDLLSTFGTENIAIQSMVEAGFVMAKSDDVSGFDYEIAKNVVKGTSDAYTKAPVEWISTALDPDASTSGAGDYVISCIVEDIPEADKNLCLATMAYIVYNDADGNLCYMFYPAINTVCFEGLYEQYYSLAFPS